MYSFRILENYSKDMFHSSIIRFHKSSYLFNCCDGTQRNILDQGIKFAKIKSIFFNSSKIDCYSGAYGFLMTRDLMNTSKTSKIKNIRPSEIKKNKNEEKRDDKTEENKN